MDHSVTPGSLAALLRTQAAPDLIDVRRQPAFDASRIIIAGAVRLLPEDAAQWSGSGPAVVYCVHGHEVSQGVATVLRGMGVDASYLEGGIARWSELGLPTRRKAGSTALWVSS